MTNRDSNISILFDLNDHGVVELVGPDASSFLQNLCTQDVRNLAVGDRRESFLTTTKARVVAHVWISQPAKDVLRLDMVGGQNAKVIEHLNHYLISERVELVDRTAELGKFRLIGPLAEAGPEVGPETQARPHRLFNLPGIDYFCPIAQSDSLRERLFRAGAVAGDPETYHRLRIEAGLPEFGIDIDESRLAMEVGRNTQAISYNKGCYLGQETIVMARDRGQANRTLTGVVFDAKTGQASVPAGTKLFRGTEDVGLVTSSVFSPRVGAVIALAYVRRGSWDPGTEVTADGRPGLVRALPFGNE